MLKNRSFEKEQLDDLSLNGEELTNTLDGLSIINRFLGNTNGTFNAVKNQILKSDKPLIVLDLGCGGGDNLRKIANWCIENEIKVELIGIDGNQNILDYAQSNTPSHYKISYHKADILSNTFKLPDCDILISSHFMYHFNDEEFVNFLNLNKKSIRKAVIFSELERSSISYILFKFFNIFLPFSKMLKQDGLQAIKRAFKKKELEYLLSKTSFIKYSVKRKWAFRLLIQVNLEE